jgi:hypothetical protein
VKEAQNTFKLTSQTLFANSLQTGLSNALEFKPIYQINPAFQPES